MSLTTPLATEERPAAPIAPVLRVNLVQPMIGIEGSRNFAIEPLGERYGAFALMRSLDEPNLTFVVVPPGAVFDDYRFEISEGDADLLGLSDAGDVETWVLITRKGVPVPTANLLGPLVVNRRTRSGAQLVLQDSGYHVAVPLDGRSARRA